MAAQESTRLMQLMEDLHQPSEYPIEFHCDNQSAIWLTEKLIFHARTMHAEVHCHFSHEKVLLGEIEME